MAVLTGQAVASGASQKWAIVDTRRPGLCKWKSAHGHRSHTSRAAPRATNGTKHHFAALAPM